MTAPPLVIDFPHSGLSAPDDWNTCLSREQWMRSADLYVDELWDSYGGMGIPAVKASFPRAYLDVNRTSDDLDPTHFLKDMELPANPSNYGKLGMGLVWLSCGPENFPIYPSPPPFSDIAERLERYYWPYHRTLETCLNAAAGRYGGYVFLDLHSMAAVGDYRSIRPPGQERPDCIIGTLDGRSAGGAFAERLRELFEAEDLRTVLNEEFKGGYLVKRYGTPDNNRHAVQVELNRRLYLRDDRMTKSESFAELQIRLGRILQAFNNYVQEYFHDGRTMGTA